MAEYKLWNALNAAKNYKWVGRFRMEHLWPLEVTGIKSGPTSMPYQV